MPFLTILRKAKLLSAKKQDYKEMLDSQPASERGSFIGNIQETDRFSQLSRLWSDSSSRANTHFKMMSDLEKQIGLLQAQIYETAEAKQPLFLPQE